MHSASFPEKKRAEGDQPSSNTSFEASQRIKLVSTITFFPFFFKVYWYLLKNSLRRWDMILALLDLSLCFFWLISIFLSRSLSFYPKLLFFLLHLFCESLPLHKFFAILPCILLTCLVIFWKNFLSGIINVIETNLYHKYVLLSFYKTSS